MFSSKIIPRKTIFAGILLSFFFFSGQSSAFWFDGEKAEVSIDVSGAAEELPETYKAGMWMFSEPEYIFNKFADDNAMGVVQFDINPLVWSKDLKDYKKLMIEWTKEGTSLRKQLDRYKREGNHVSIGIVGATSIMPRWLSSYDMRPAGDPVCQGQMVVVKDGRQYCDAYSITFTDLYGYTIGANTLPRDWKIWKEVVQFAARYYHEEIFTDLDIGRVNGLGMKNISFWLGHEPDWDFFGSEDEYFDFYYRTMSAVKEIYPGIKTGGIGASFFLRVKACPYLFTENENLYGFCDGPYAYHDTRDDEPMLKNFLEYRQDGKHKLPIDFINYHQWEASRFGNYFPVTMAESATWMRENGFDPEKVSHYPADWNISGLPIKMDPQHDRKMDSELRAAYVVSTLYDMRKAGIIWHSADFGVVDKDGERLESKKRNDSVFVGGWPIFTKVSDSFVVKPVYNAFKVLSIVAGKNEKQTPNEIKVSFSEKDFITAIASQTKDKSKTRIILANYVPSDGIMAKYLMSKFQELPSMLSTKEYVSEVKNCAESSKSETSDQQVRLKNCFERIIGKVADPVIKERMKTQFNLLACFNFSADKKKCVSAEVKATKDTQTKKDLKTIRAEYKRTIKNQSSPRKIKLALKNISFNGEVKIVSYAIDKNNSNSCAYNKKTEKAKTAAECGVDGAVDLAVKQAKSEARSKAVAEAVKALRSKGITEEQIEASKQNIIEPCLAGDNFAKCAVEKLEANCSQKGTFDCDKLKPEMAKVYDVYSEAYKDLFYYGRHESFSGETIRTASYIDKINNDPRVSLEGSRREMKVKVKKGGILEKTIKINPYGVVLLEVSK